MDSAVIKILASLDFTMLQYVGDDQFEAIYCNPDWFHVLVPAATKSGQFKIEGYSPFLDDFIMSAQALWEQGRDKKLASGIWTEQLDNGSLLHLEAEALHVDGKGFLLIKNLADKFKEQQKTLQLARELSISNEVLAQQHQHSHERLQSLLQKSDNIKDLFDSVSQAIEKSNVATIITDGKLEYLVENPAVNELFGSHINTKNSGALKLLLSLIDKQHPAFNQNFHSHRAWQGELCWLQSSVNMKWLMLSVYPVKSTTHKSGSWIFFISDVTRVKHLQSQNEKLSVYDNLTNLPNRLYFWNTLDRLVNQRMPFYMVYLDIDNFKLINDEYGHVVGDDVLATVAERLKRALKKDDIVARVGGNEYAIVLTGISNHLHCANVIKRLQKVLGMPFTHNKVIDLSLLYSFGATQFPDDGDTVEKLTKNADLAAYHAKKQDGQSFVFFSTDLKQASENQIKLKKELYSAIEGNQFELYFQPIIQISNKKIAKVEALIRWNHPTLGIVMPDNFIPLAEDTGLITIVGKWVFKRACERLKQLKQQGYSLTMAINLSPRQLNDSNLEGYIKATLQKYAIDAKDIELEITEGILINDFDSVLHLLQILKQIGVNLSIDDFGSGYSSLAYLKRLPINTLKIDRSFVTDLSQDDNDKAIVSAVIAMAHKLNLHVIAEGVEENSQLAYLESNQCDYIQGYLYSKPLRFDSLCELLSESVH